MSGAPTTVVITGASSGLGRQLAHEFARRGAQLVLFARGEARLKETEAECRKLGAADTLVVVGDVTQAKDCQSLVDQTVARFGGIDCFLANAGISMWTRFADVDDVGIFRRLIETNFLGVVQCARAALRPLQQRRGMLVIISSIQAKVGVPFHSGYSASKHALEGWVDALRCELAGTGVEILKVYPHWLLGTRLRENAIGGDGQLLGERRHKSSDGAVSVELCARKIAEAVGRRRQVLYVPWHLCLLPWLKLLMPLVVRRYIRRRVGNQEQ